MLHYETILHEAGFALAIRPLRELFEREHVDDARLRAVLTREVIEHTASALAALSRARMVH